jgi:hypothetical protein
VPACGDELGGQRQVSGLAGFPVQLGQRGLDDGVPVEPAALPEERVHQVVGEVPGHLEQPGPPVARLFATAA